MQYPVSTMLVYLCVYKQKYRCNMMQVQKPDNMNETKTVAAYPICKSKVVMYVDILTNTQHHVE